MQTTIGAGPALEPQPQSTRAAQLVARGYTPARPLCLVAAWFHFRKALRAHLRALSTAQYHTGELCVAFLGGLLLAACVFVPFLIHVTR